MSHFEEENEYGFGESHDDIGWDDEDFRDYDTEHYIEDDYDYPEDLEDNFYDEEFYGSTMD